LAAKPIIDLQAGIVKPTSVPSLTPILAAAGYEDLGEAGVPGRQYFRRRQPPVAANLHIVWNRKLWRQNPTQRDYLRAYPEEADYYGCQKREILAQGGSTRLVYSEAKAPILKELIRKAQAWARQLSGVQADLRDAATSGESSGPAGTGTRQSTLSSVEREADRERSTAR
jgi:GrpB-like predicted nucleotidyltransferase (UPF0157 family)